MYIDDTLSRAYLSTTEDTKSEQCEICALESVNHEEHIHVTKPKRDEYREKIAADADIQQLIQIIKEGWPERADCKAILR